MAPPSANEIWHERLLRERRARGGLLVDAEYRRLIKRIVKLMFQWRDGDVDAGAVWTAWDELGDHLDIGPRPR